MTLQQAQASVRRRLQLRSREGMQSLREPNLEALRAFACLVDECVVELNEVFDLEEALAAFLRSSILQCAFPALVWYRRGDPQRAGEWIVRSWQSHTLAFVRLDVVNRGLLSSEVKGGLDGPSTAPDESEPEYLAAYNLAVSELLASRLQDAKARLILRRLMAYLGLSLEHLARILRVPADAVRLWERGQAEVPHSRMGELLLADAALTRLLAIFRPDRLSQVVRRKADLFDQDHALDWILRGRIAEVADRYDAALAYQS